MSEPKKKGGGCGTWLFVLLCLGALAWWLGTITALGGEEFWASLGA